MSKLTDRSLIDLLTAFRSPDPTPGGGSAAALAGAVGASLLTMVAQLPKPRATTQADVERLAAAGVRCSTLGDKLTELVNHDSAAYDEVMGAYRLPKSTEEEKGLRIAAIQRALRRATDVPLEVMRSCAEALDEANVVASLGNANASSDVQVSIELLGAGLRGAGYNVEINLEAIRDAEYVAGARAEKARLLSKGGPSGT
jgi:formiminotetrahydrofolate cyclodeaminase